MLFSLLFGSYNCFVQRPLLSDAKEEACSLFEVLRGRHKTSIPQDDQSPILAIGAFLQATHRLRVEHILGIDISLQQVLVRIRHLQQLHGLVVLVQARLHDLDAVHSHGWHMPGDHLSQIP